MAITVAPLVGDGGAVTWCPGSAAHEDCAGIPVTGLSSAAIDALDQSLAWQVEGLHDGVTVRATGEPEPVDGAEPDFTTPCADLRGQSSEAGNPNVDAQEAVQRYLATIPDRHAGIWWDSSNSVLTVLLTGDDVDEHRAALEDAVGDRGTVCVVGGARWSFAELEQMQQRALDIAIAEGMGPWGGGTDIVSNRVNLEVERSDAGTVDRIREEAGEAVRVRSFNRGARGHDRRPASTTQTRRRGVGDGQYPQRCGHGRAGHVHGPLRFRTALRHGEFASERVGLVWPFGYWAESDPLRVYDQDGQLVASEGDVLESGGGQVPRDGPEVCGTSEAWVVNGRPSVVGPSDG